MALLLAGARLVGAPDEIVDVLIDDGRVASIRPAGMLPARHCEVLALDGRFLGPSVRDAHVHFSQWAMLSQRLDLTAARSAADAARRVREHLNARGGEVGRRLVGHGYRDALWPDTPHRDLLDAISSTREIVLVGGDLHSAWVNSPVLRRLGFDESSSGYLRELDAMRVTTDAARARPEQLDAWAAAAADEAAARGVTEIVDFEWAPNVEVWQRRMARRLQPLRVHCAVYPDHLDAAIRQGLRTGATIEGTCSLVKVGALKIVADGSLTTRTAYCDAPYTGPSHEQHRRGQLDYDVETLTALMRRGADNGLVPAVHAIGDATNRVVLDAFETIGSGGWIEHAQLLCPQDFKRFRSLNVAASVQPEHAMDDRDIADALWRERTQRAYAYGSLAEAGAELVFGSDAPVAPLNPWDAMASAVFRTRDGRDAWHPEQRVTARAAYAASTAGRRTTIAEGAVADLTATDYDPLHASEAELRTIPVAVTLLEGRVTHRAL